MNVTGYVPGTAAKELQDIARQRRSGDVREAGATKSSPPQAGSATPLMGVLKTVQPHVIKKIVATEHTALMLTRAYA